MASAVASTCSAVVPRSQSYTLSKITSKRRSPMTRRSAAASLRSATRFSTRLEKLCLERRCRMATEWPAFSRSATSRRPMNSVPPMTSTFMQRGATTSVVIFQAEVRDQRFAAHPAQRVFQFHQLNENVVLGIKPRRRHGRFEVEREPFLHAAHAGALRQVQEQHQVEHQRRRQYGIAAQEIDLALHRVAQPAEDVDVIPTLFGVAARRVIVDPDFVIDVLVKVGIEIRL